MKLFAALALAVALWPQQQTTPTFLETLEVRITNLDVVVTDRRGHAVRGLKRDDFVLLEGGKPQTITNFAEYSGSSGVGQSVAAGTAPAPPEAPQLRKFLFYIDEMSLTNSTRAKLLDSATALVRKEMHPGDEAMVVTRAKAPGTVLEFTGDRELVEARLRNAIDQTAFGARTASQAEELFYNSIHSSSGREYASMARVYATRVERRVTSTLRTLLGLVGSLNQVSGRKVMVVVSESLSSEPGREAFTLETIQSNTQPTALEMASLADSSGELPLSVKFDPAVMSAHASWFDARPMIKELAARASANGITIYSLQPDVAKSTSIPGGQIATPRRPTSSPQQALRFPTSTSTSSVDQFHRQIVEGTRNTLQTLADDTGGKFFIGANQIDDGFRQIAEDLTAYYSIGYRTEGGGDNGVRKIDVRVKNRPELVVRARRELLRRTPEREMDEIVAANLIAPRNVNELEISAAAGRPEHHIDSYRVPVVVRVPLSKLTFIPDGGRYRASFTLHFAAADGADYTASVYREQTLEIPAADIDVMRKRIYAHTAILVVAPGTLKVAVGVYDRYSRLTGFQQIEVLAR